MLATFLKGATASALSGVYLVDIQAVSSGSSVTLDLGKYQTDRVLVFGCYIRQAPTNGVPSTLQVNGSGVTTIGTNSSGSSGYLYGISTTTGTSCTFQPTATTSIDGYVVAVWAVYGVLAGSFSDTAQSESASATSRSANVSTAGDLLFALALGQRSTLALNMGTNGTVDSTLASFTTGLGTTLFYLAGHRDPSSTATVSCTQSTSGILLLYLASAT
jgi:hypothetical protein